MTKFVKIVLEFSSREPVNYIMNIHDTMEDAEKLALFLLDTCTNSTLTLIIKGEKYMSLWKSEVNVVNKHGAVVDFNTASSFMDWEIKREIENEFQFLMHSDSLPLMKRFMR